ncbi:EmrB/QacA subfamily drug resistance transporter [Actinophytocola algeriensis]|uniref:EmrB/QacA subfamily drug resistance transporter n=1 Tax=Actinophytocola algeriensis TaxID=1768010 RepID=A0A7W7Q7A7_9PSEU|nr:EmrB/QacA subfamily drug resistance transporter [Actinophytocola algeriensis]MBE1480183.1 EmrB/QacA subfamily drug resistance transporter [Actinophytocola algeriensis]
MTAQTMARPVAARPGVALALILTCQLMLMLDVTVMNVALPRIRTDLGFTPAGLSWVMNAYTLVFGGLLLLGGRLGDLFGRRRVFLAGVAVFTAASLAGGLADSAGLLIASRIVQGLGAAAAGPSTIALITSTFTEPRARVRALSLFSAMASSGFAVGLILGGLLTEWLTWRSVMFINVPFGVVVLVFGARHIAEPERHPAKLDVTGAVLATLGVASLVYGFIRAAEAGWGAASAVWPLVAGAVLVVTFVWSQTRVGHPMLPLRLFADRDRAAGYANFFLGPLSMMSAFFFLTQFLQEVSGYGALATGFAFLPMAVGIFVLSRAVPWLLPLLGPKPIAVTGTLLMSGGLWWVAQLSAGSGYVPGVLGPMVLMGVGGGLAFAPLNVLIMGTVPPADAGAAGGALQTMQQIGATLGLAVLVTVAGSASRGHAGTDALVTGMTAAFTTSAFVALLTFGVALTFKRR